MIKLISKLAFAAALAIGGSANAESWKLDGGASKLAFGSVKKDTVGEVHSFENLTGTASKDGTVTIDIDLASVQTNIDIRNERMIEHVFKGMAKATLNAKIDMEAINGLTPGQSTVVDAEAVLSLLGTDVELEAEMFVLRVSETQVMVTTNDMIWLGVEDAGITAGIDKLQELAKLPGITRTVPVTMRLIFDMSQQKAEATSTAASTQVAAVAIDGDVKKGKKVFKRCKACHSLKEDKHGSGPSLFQIVGAPAAQADFRYSAAMSDAGLTWDVETLTAFLTKPKKFLKGTSMSFPGLKKESDIQNLIAYLANP